jgi:hypothetical protein
LSGFNPFSLHIWPFDGASCWFWKQLMQAALISGKAGLILD